MPLLMKSLTTEELPPEIAVEIPGGEARAVDLAVVEGRLLRQLNRVAHLLEVAAEDRASGL